MNDVLRFTASDRHSVPGKGIFDLPPSKELTMHFTNPYRALSCRRTQTNRTILALAAWLLVATVTSIANAQITAKGLTDPNLTDSERKQATMLWLDKYLTDSELMRKEDTAKIHQAVSNMSPSQLRQWLQSTRELAEYVESPQWQETKRWLRNFLRVQAMYSDKEIEKLRSDILNADANQMLAILKRIHAKHASLTWMHQASEKSRAMAVKQRNASVAKQASAVASARSSGSSSAPLFGAGFSKGQKPSKGYRPPAPLITSRDVARATVWSEVWGGRGWAW